MTNQTDHHYVCVNTITHRNIYRVMHIRNP